MFLKTANTEGNYDALPSAKLCTAICQKGRSIGVKKLANSDILLVWLNFFSDIYNNNVKDAFSALMLWVRQSYNIAATLVQITMVVHT